MCNLKDEPKKISVSDIQACNTLEELHNKLNQVQNDLEVDLMFPAGIPTFDVIEEYIDYYSDADKDGIDILDLLRAAKGKCFDFTPPSIVKARKDAVDIMEHVKNNNYLLDMNHWQDYELDGLKNTALEIHQCGSSACFAGYVAVSDQWKAIPGNTVADDGSPVSKEHPASTCNAFSKWLGISRDNVEHLIGVQSDGGDGLYGTSDESEITIDHVLEVLYRLRDTGSIWHAQ